MKSIWKIIRIALVAVGVIVLAAVVKLGLSGYELQVSGIKNQVIEIRFDRTNKVRYGEMVKLLREAGRYKADTAEVKINHIPYAERAEEIREYFCLDTLYDARASTWEKTLAIGKFVASNIPHDNQKEYPEYVNAIGLWEYTKTVAPAFNCRLHSILTYELLTAAGIKARYITCLPYDRNDNDCHVVNEVWLPETGKWVMIDTDMRRYITDKKGNLLSLAEIREHFINDKKIVVYYDFENPSSRISYYYAYMAKNTYWFCRWGDLGFYQEDYKTFPESKLRSRYYALVPEGFETFSGREITTNDSEQFWK
ncbi:MAG: transglutaminase domain-containing protein [Bacteroidales bacterium]|nr:transglutaminase domain-containing protein [Bacteroidales bacterium]